MENNRFSSLLSVFHERTTPEEGFIVGYAALLIRFLEQGKGELSQRAKSKTFKELTAEEVLLIQEKYHEVFIA